MAIEGGAIGVFFLDVVFVEGGGVDTSGEDGRLVC